MNVSITCVKDEGKAILTLNLVHPAGDTALHFPVFQMLLFMMHLIFHDDHLPLLAPDFVCDDSAAKTSLGEGLVTGVFVHLSLAFVQKPDDQAALTDSMLIPQTHG